MPDRSFLLSAVLNGTAWSRPRGGRQKTTDGPSTTGPLSLAAKSSKLRPANGKRRLLRSPAFWKREEPPWQFFASLYPGLKSCSGPARLKRNWTKNLLITLRKWLPLKFARAPLLNRHVAR